MNNRNVKEELIDYIHDDSAKVIFTIFGIAFIGAAPCLYLFTPSVPFCLLFALLGVGFLILQRFQNRAAKAYLEEIERSGQLDILAEDFANTQSFFDGKLKLGNTYLFASNKMPCSYRQIGWVYEEVHKRDNVETVRKLTIKDTEGKFLTSCMLPRNGKADQEVRNVMARIKLKNPAVVLGY